ncbi:MAG: hypothetical protein LBU91_05645 [Bacteroidales bacterium]|jgi:hypothetical protein|nr:hypothetical protein [Bacteroidales bacterium]
MKTFLVCMLCFPTILGHAGNYVLSELQRNPEQPQEERDVFKQKIRTHKVAFFTEKLSLTSAEAEKFWPVYNAYFESRDKLMSNFFEETRCKDCGCSKNKMDDCKFDISKLSDAEVNKLLNDRAKLIDLEKNFHNDLCKLFSPRRVLTFYNAEREFQRELIRQRPRNKYQDTKLEGNKPPKYDNVKKVRTTEHKKVG